MSYSECWMLIVYAIFVAEHENAQACAIFKRYFINTI